MTTINVKISKNDAILKSFTAPVQLQNQNWPNYIKSLKDIQKNVNVFLTELVENQKNVQDNSVVEEECEDEDSADDEDLKEIPKRKLSDVNKVCKKTRT